MILVLYGSDNYRRSKKINSIVYEFIKKHPRASVRNFDFSYLPEEELAEFQGFIKNQSLFESAKLGVLRNSLAECGNRRALKKLFEEAMNSEAATLVLSEEKSIPKEFSFLKEAKNLGHVKLQEFAILDEEQLVAYIRKEAETRGVNLDAFAQRILVEKFKNDTWGLMTAIEKLSLFDKPSFGGEIADILDIYEENNFFNCIGQMAHGDLQTKISTLERLLAEKGDGAKIFNVLAYQKKEHIVQFADYDVAIKSGKIDYEEALLDFVLL